MNIPVDLISIISAVLATITNVFLLIIAYFTWRLSKTIAGMQSLTALATYDAAIREQLIANPDVALLLDKDIGDLGQIVEVEAKKYGTDERTLIKALHLQLARINLWATMYSLVVTKLISRDIWDEEYIPWIRAEFST